MIKRPIYKKHIKCQTNDKCVYLMQFNNVVHFDLTDNESSSATNKNPINLIY